MIGKIIDYDHKGFGLVKEEEPVFLDGGVIEDLVDYKIINSGKIKRGQINKIIKPSIFRVKSPCPYSKECGGCPLMETDYKKELEWKREKVRNNLLRIGKIETEIEEILDKRTKRIPIKGAIKQYTKELDSEGAYMDMALRSVVYPNLDDEELQQFYGTVGAEDTLKAILIPGELTDLLLAVQEACGYNVGMKDEVKHVKNS